MTLAVAAQQDLAHRARRARPAGGDDRREQRRLARQRHHAGPLRRADDEDAQAAQLAERDREIEVGEQPPDLRAQVLLEIGGLDAGDVEAADLRQVEHAVAVDRAAVVDVDRAPGAGHDLVAGADRVVGRDRHVVERLEVLGGVGEERRAEDRQQPAGRAFDEALELVRLRRRRRLDAGAGRRRRRRGRARGAPLLALPAPPGRPPLGAGGVAGSGCRARIAVALPGVHVALRIARRREGAAAVGLVGGLRRRSADEQRTGRQRRRARRSGEPGTEREGRHHREEAGGSREGAERRVRARRW